MRRERASLRLGASTCTVAAILALASCGGDEEPIRATPTQTAPAVTGSTSTAPPAQPTATVPTDPPQTSTTTIPDAAPGRGGGAVAPTETTPRKQDEETPAERFERYCDENPGACG